jgi:nucleoside-diphosphate-sugar epimerase
MRALVTGAAGFIGSHLVDALVARGDDVVGVDCFTPYYERAVKEHNLAAARSHPSFELVEADLRSADLAPLVEGVDCVFHQAAQPGVRLSWAEGFEQYVSCNVLATQRLLEAVARAGVRRFVFASSSSVYGNQARYPTTESDLPRPYSPYGVTKLAAEHLCSLYAENWGVPTVALRYFTVYGPRQRPDMSIHRLCEASRSGAQFPVFGDGRQVREFTYVSDIVAGNLLAAERAVEPGTCMNLAGGSEISLTDLIGLVGELAGAAVKIAPEPARAGDAVRNGGATDRARELLGWRPEVDLRTGITEQLAWHRARAAERG